MSEISRAFGKALFDLARDEGISDRVLDELNVIDGVFKDNPEYLKLLSSYELEKRLKRELLDECFKAQAHEYVLSYMKLMTDKGIISEFSSALQAYKGFYNEANGILEVSVYSAYPLSDEQCSSLKGKLEKLSGKKVTLLLKRDTKSIGGVRLEYGDISVDDTLRHRLNEMKKQLSSVETV